MDNQQTNQEVEQPTFSREEFGMDKSWGEAEKNAAVMEFPKYPILGIDSESKQFVTQDGDAVGDTMKGVVVIGQNKIYTDAGKQKDADKRTYSDNICLKSRAGKLFGIWLTGDLRKDAKRLLPGDFVSIKYLGQAAEPRNPGEDAPHLFELKAADANGRAVSLADRLAAAPTATAAH
jgi:hypothetical protein